MMVSSMMTSSTSLRAPFTAARPMPCRAIPQRARVTAAASKEESEWKPAQAPGQAVLRAVGALAAAQLAFLPAAGAEGIQDLLPNSATSESARAAVNERTSNLPSFTDIGDSLKNVLGTSSDPKDIGRAIDRNTPDGPDLIKNPKDLAEDAKAGASSLASKVQNAAPDLSAVNEPLTDRTGLPNPFDKGSGGIPRASDISELAGRAKKEAGSLGNDVAKKTPDVKDVKNAGSSLASKVQNALPDSAGLPSPQEAADKVKGKIDEVGRNVQGVGSDNPLGGKVPSPQETGDKLKGKVNEAGRKAQNALPDSAGLPSPQEAADKAKGKVNEVGRNVQGAGSNNPLSGKIPSPQEAADKLKGKVNEAGRKVQNSLPDSADLPSPQEALDKVKGAVGSGSNPVGDNLQSKASEIGSKAAQFPGASTAEGGGNATGGPSELADKMETFKAKVEGKASGLGGKVRGE